MNGPVREYFQGFHQDRTAYLLVHHDGAPVRNPLLEGTHKTWSYFNLVDGAVCEWLVFSPPIGQGRLTYRVHIWAIAAPPLVMLGRNTGIATYTGLHQTIAAYFRALPGPSPICQAVGSFVPPDPEDRRTAYAISLAGDALSSEDDVPVTSADLHDRAVVAEAAIASHLDSGSPAP